MSWLDDVHQQAAEALTSIAEEPEDVRATVGLNTVLFHLRVMQLVLRGIEVPIDVGSSVEQALYRTHEAASWVETAMNGIPLPEESAASDGEVVSGVDGKDDLS